MEHAYLATRQQGNRIVQSARRFAPAVPRDHGAGTKRPESARAGDDKDRPPRLQHQGFEKLRGDVAIGIVGIVLASHDQSGLADFPERHGHGLSLRGAPFDVDRQVLYRSLEFGADLLTRFVAPGPVRLQVLRRVVHQVEPARIWCKAHKEPHQTALVRHRQPHRHIEPDQRPVAGVQVDEDAVIGHDRLRR
ncbi:hypothetical protein D3C87_1118170 [compost metagenome]